MQSVWGRWSGKSVLSSVADAESLCIVPYHKHDANHPPTADDLVLVTSKEAQHLGKMSGERRNKKFPLQVQNQMIKKPPL